MIQSAIATAADYADAMITTRRAKNILFGIILVMLLVQLALFLAARYWIDLGGPTLSNGANPSTRLADWLDKLKYLVGLIDFLGVAAPILLAVVLLLLTLIMLVGRLVGVSHLVSSFLWCVVLILLLFPWQAFLINQTFTSSEFKFAGVLYNWQEVVMRARLHPTGAMALSFWGRFIVAPVIALILLLTIQMQSRRGLRLAFGEGIAPPAADTNIPA